jgi:hypothetical protein
MNRLCLKHSTSLIGRNCGLLSITRQNISRCVPFLWEIIEDPLIVAGRVEAYELLYEIAHDIHTQVPDDFGLFILAGNLEVLCIVMSGSE